jgi:putative SOS response-associated peptidase YedK
MLDQPTRNSRQRYNICPTTTIDTVVSSEGKRALVPMRWGLIPYWWNKPLKEMRLANLLSCTIVITEPNKFVAEVHNRSKGFRTMGARRRQGRCRTEEAGRRERVAEVAGFETRE